MIDRYNPYSQFDFWYSCWIHHYFISNHLDAVNHINKYHSSNGESLYICLRCSTDNDFFRRFNETGVDISIMPFPDRLEHNRIFHDYY